MRTLDMSCFSDCLYLEKPLLGPERREQPDPGHMLVLSCWVALSFCPGNQSLRSFQSPPSPAYLFLCAGAEWRLTCTSIPSPRPPNGSSSLCFMITNVWGSWGRTFLLLYMLMCLNLLMTQIFTNEQNLCSIHRTYTWFWFYQNWLNSFQRRMVYYSAPPVIELDFFISVLC